MATCSEPKSKPLCKYGSSCYRKNKEHLRQYAHPQKESVELEKAREEEPSPSLAEEDPSPSLAKKARIDNEVAENTDAEKVEETINEEQEDDKKVIVKSKFLVAMPDDFYQFWDFCSMLNSTHPHLALKDSLGLELVGPYHILAGKLKGVPTEKCLLHYRYFHDPPELMTVLGGADNGFHIGYYRDDPNTTDCFLVTAASSKEYVLKPSGINIFSAVSLTIQQRLQSKSLSAKDKGALNSLSKKLTSHAAKLGLDMSQKKPRGRKPVASCLHSAGICVPVNTQLDIGYRPLPMTNRELVKLLNKISSFPNPSTKRDQASEPLQEMITCVQFANDEYDFGMGLELGIDLFCHSDQFDNSVSHLLPLAYELLGRQQYKRIITEHLKNRQSSPLNFDK